MKYFLHCVKCFGIRRGFYVWRTCRLLSKDPGLAQELVASLRRSAKDVLITGDTEFYDVLETFADDIQSWLDSLDGRDPAKLAALFCEPLRHPTKTD